MFKIASCCLLALASFHAPSVGYAQNPEKSLTAYAATITKTVPFREPFAGYAIYLGGGEVISAAHVVGRWPFRTRPTVHIAGLDLPMEVLKMGSSAGVDITLLKIDETKLPVSLRMRVNPLCTTAPAVGEEVFGVVPDRVVRTQIASPQTIPKNYRERYGTLVSSVVTPSGSGIFRGKTKCLLGIMSKAVPRFKYWPEGQLQVPDGVAGYFVPSTQIIQFLGIKAAPPPPTSLSLDY
jgi:hypothetical protein